MISQQKGPLPADLSNPMASATNAATPQTSRIVYCTRPDGAPIEWETCKLSVWPGIRAQYRRLAGPINYEFSFTGKAHRFVLLDIQRLDGETLVDGFPKITLKDLRDKFVFAGAGHDVSGWSQIARPASFTLLELEPHESDGISNIAPIVVQANPLIRSILQQFKAFLIDEVDPLTEYVETLRILLPQEIMRIGMRNVFDQDLQGGLTKRQLRVAIAYMEDRLEREVSIADMAQQLGISPFHFIRMFKKACGIPPHKFLLRRRIERAQELLRSSDLTVSEVAEMSGFGGLTQLTRAFRKVVGSNPSQYRKDIA